MSENEIREKRRNVSIRLSELEIYSDNGFISENKFKKLRLKLITELHTLDAILNHKLLDSDEWFEEIKKELGW